MRARVFSEWQLGHFCLVLFVFCLLLIVSGDPENQKKLHHDLYICQGGQIPWCMFLICIIYNSSCRRWEPYNLHDLHDLYDLGTYFLGWICTTYIYIYPAQHLMEAG